MHSVKSTTLRFHRALYNDHGQASRRHWWLGNGTGAWSSGNIVGTGAAPCQVLFVCPQRASLAFVRAVISLISDDGDQRLFPDPGKNDQPADAPGFSIDSFRLEGRMPAWRVNAAGVRLEHRIWMEPGARTVYLAFRAQQTPGHRHPAPGLKIQCLVALREAREAGQPIRLEMKREKRRILVRSNEGSSLIFQACGNETTPRPGTEPPEPLPAGDTSLWTPPMELELSAGEWIGIAASFDGPPSPYLEEAMRRFRAHQHTRLTQMRLQAAELADRTAWIEPLLLHADSLLPASSPPEHGEINGDGRRRERSTALPEAILPVLPGLTLATGRFSDARRILEDHTDALQTRAPEDPGRSSVPWLLEGWRAYFDQVPDPATLKGVAPVLDDIVHRYRNELERLCTFQARPSSVEEETAADTFSHFLETGALWFNALHILSTLHRRRGRDAGANAAAAENLRAALNHAVNRATTGPASTVGDTLGHCGLGVGSILAVSLPFSPLTGVSRITVLDQCRRLLLPVYGLSRKDDCPSTFEAFGAGMGACGQIRSALPRSWWLGQYALAEYRVHGNAAAARALLEPLRDAALAATPTEGGSAMPGPPGELPGPAWSALCTLDAWWRLERTLKLARTEDKGRGRTGALERPLAALGVKEF